MKEYQKQQNLINIKNIAFIVRKPSQNLFIKTGMSQTIFLIYSRKIENKKKKEQKK